MGRILIKTGGFRGDNMHDNMHLKCFMYKSLICTKMYFFSTIIFSFLFKLMFWVRTFDVVNKTTWMNIFPFAQSPNSQNGAKYCTPFCPLRRFEAFKTRF